MVVRLMNLALLSLHYNSRGLPQNERSKSSFLAKLLAFRYQMLSSPSLLGPQEEIQPW